MLEFADEEMRRNKMEAALEYFSELLELLYFKFLPGVLLRRAECLLNLVKYYHTYTLHCLPSATCKKNIGQVFTLLPQLGITS